MACPYCLSRSCWVDTHNLRLSFVVRGATSSMPLEKAKHKPLISVDSAHPGFGVTRHRNVVLMRLPKNSGLNHTLLQLKKNSEVILNPLLMVVIFPDR